MYKYKERNRIIERTLMNGVILLGLLFASCQNGNKEERPASPSQESVAANVLIMDTLSNGDITLYRVFDNEQGILQIRFEPEEEIIELTQQPMASGIKYRNDHYEYTEWHGEALLLKEGAIIFEHNIDSIPEK